VTNRDSHRKPGSRPQHTTARPPEWAHGEARAATETDAGEIRAAEASEADAARAQITEAEPTEPDASQAGAPTVPLDQYQRLLAEFDNFRKRMERDIARAGFLARVDLFKALLPTLDDFGRARSSLGPEEDSFDRDGMLIIMDRFAETLSSEGLSEVEASPGQAFDPEIHEAVLTVPTAKFAAGCVSEVLEKGYRCGERLLRPAKVAVARPPEDMPPDAKRGQG
jgi:molecular chaperone GrpE